MSVISALCFNVYIVINYISCSCLCSVPVGINIYIIFCAGITKINPDIGGLKLIVMDEKSDAFIYNPVNLLQYQLARRIY